MTVISKGLNPADHVPDLESPAAVPGLSNARFKDDWIPAKRRKEVISVRGEKDAAGTAARHRAVELLDAVKRLDWSESPVRENPPPAGFWLG